MIGCDGDSSLQPSFRLRIATLFKWSALNATLARFPAGERKYVRQQLWLFIQTLVAAGVSVDVVVRSVLPHLVTEFDGSSGELVDQISQVNRDVGAGHAMTSVWLSQPFVALAKELWAHTHLGTRLSQVAGEALIRSGDRRPIASAEKVLEECERLDREYQDVVSYMGSSDENDYLALASMNVGYPPSGTVEQWRSMVAAHDLVDTYRTRLESWRAFEGRLKD